MPLFDINQTLTKNIAFSTISRFGAQCLAVLSNFILARALGVTGFGEYAFISAIVMIGNAVTTFGTDMVLIRKISAEKDYSEISSSLVIQLIISCIFILSVFTFASSSALRIYIFSLIPLSFFTIATIALRGSHEINIFSVLHFLFSLFQFISASIVFLTQKNIYQIALLLLISHTVSAFVGILFCIIKIPHFSKHLMLFPKKIFSLLQVSFSLAVIGSLRLIYERLAITLMPFLANLSVTGLLSASMRVMDATKLGYISAFTPIYPEMARDKKFLSHQTGFNLLLLSAIFFSLILFFSSRFIINVLFGDEFMEAIPSLQILAWILVPYVIVSYYSLGFVALDIQKPVLIALSLSLLVLMIMLPMAYQVYGLVGSVYVILFAEIIQAVSLWLQWRKYVLPKLS